MWCAIAFLWLCRYCKSFSLFELRKWYPGMLQMINATYQWRPSECPGSPLIAAWKHKHEAYHPRIHLFQFGGSVIDTDNLSSHDATLCILCVTVFLYSIHCLTRTWPTPLAASLSKKQVMANTCIPAKTLAQTFMASQVIKIIPQDTAYHVAYATYKVGRPSRKRITYCANTPYRLQATISATLVARTCCSEEGPILFCFISCRSISKQEMEVGSCLKGPSKKLLYYMYLHFLIWYLNLNLNIFIAPCTNKYTSEKHAIKWYNSLH